jgi:predicted nucleotide-binding protein
MAKINQNLLQRIADKQHISLKAVYPQITKIVHETFLERDLAALVLASRLHINIRKYSTPDQREQIRGYLSGGHRGAPAPGAVSPAAPAAPAARGRANSTKGVLKKDNSIFVIGGRDTALTESMFNFLSALGCKPVEFHQAVARVRGTSNPFIGVVLDKVFEQMQALVVLFSPDDEVKLKDQFLKPSEVMTEGRYCGQARPNVIFEAGMALARHEEKTIMVQVGDIKSFSDIAGRHMVHLDDSFESRNDFAGRLGKLCKVDTSGNRWTKVGKFEPAGAAVALPAPAKGAKPAARKKRR